MSTLVWPALAPSELIKAKEATLPRELEWLLASLHDTLQSLKAGLPECAELLALTEPGSMLVLSSVRSEQLKCFVTRVGARIVKGEVQLRLPSLPALRGQTSYKLSISPLPTAPTIALEQLTTTCTLINACLDAADATRWTGDCKNANFISGQLRLLYYNIQEAKATLKDWAAGQRPWNEVPVDVDAFAPLLPANVSFHLSVSEAAVLLNVRMLEAADPNTGTNTPMSFTSGTATPSYTGLSLRDRLATALGGGRPAFHDEAHEMVMYRG
ncbi:hypothetical protein LTR35_017915 [Friedmanniomyces endolithicus]|nr:hypothetical protein LTR35_017915 [Friedmanniomyces endolithicus]KAK0267422.1 hypothetical protein LTS00_017802 [Friedmanniomyces endolithicus]KAK0970449.1 hypothetical protein LTR54_017951 [Friedmanniomyces endolithicus]